MPASLLSPQLSAMPSAVNGLWTNLHTHAIARLFHQVREGGLMRRWMCVALVLGVAFAGELSATQYPVVPESGTWLILIQSYTGENSGDR